MGLKKVNVYTVEGNTPVPSPGPGAANFVYDIRTNRLTAVTGRHGNVRTINEGVGGGESVESTPPIAIYPTLSDMLIGQENQIENNIYEVTIASGDTTNNISFGKAWYRKTSGSTQAISDYVLINKEDHNEIKFGNPSLTIKHSEALSFGIDSYSSVVSQSINAIDRSSTIIVFVTSGLEVGVSRDSGESFKIFDLSSYGVQNLRHVKIVGTDIIICGRGNSQAIVMKSSNYGNNWSTLLTTASSNIFNKLLITGTTFIVLGVSGLVAKSTNSGTAWSTQVVHSTSTAFLDVSYNTDADFNERLTLVGYEGVLSVVATSIDIGDTYTTATDTNHTRFHSVWHDTDFIDTYIFYGGANSSSNPAIYYNLNNVETGSIAINSETNVYISNMYGAYDALSVYKVYATDTSGKMHVINFSTKQVEESYQISTVNITHFLVFNNTWYLTSSTDIYKSDTGLGKFPEIKFFYNNDQSSYSLISALDPVRDDHVATKYYVTKKIKERFDVLDNKKTVNTYADISTMLANQADQEEGGIYEVTNASADTTNNVRFGKAWYRKKSTSAGVIADYQLIVKEDIDPNKILGGLHSFEHVGRRDKYYTDNSTYKGTPQPAAVTYDFNYTDLNSLNPNSFAVKDGKLYSIQGTNLVVYSMTDFSTLATVNLSTYITNTAHVGKIHFKYHSNKNIFILHSNYLSGIVFYDITTDAAYLQATTEPVTVIHNNRETAFNRIAYVGNTTWNTWGVVDFTNLASLVHNSYTETFNVGAIGHGVVNNNYLLLGNYDANQVLVYDMTDQANRVLINTISTSGPPQAIMVFSDLSGTQYEQIMIVHNSTTSVKFLRTESASYYTAFSVNTDITIGGAGFSGIVNFADSAVDGEFIVVTQDGKFYSYNAETGSLKNSADLGSNYFNFTGYSFSVPDLYVIKKYGDFTFFNLPGESKVIAFNSATGKVSIGLTPTNIYTGSEEIYVNNESSLKSAEISSKMTIFDGTVWKYLK